MELLKNIYLLVAERTNPMRSWRGAEYVNYVHIVSFFVLMFFATPTFYLLDSNRLNFAGLVIFVAVMAIALERLQRLIGGKNTMYKSIKDIFWSIVGGSIPPLFAVYLGFASWTY